MCWWGPCFEASFALLLHLFWGVFLDGFWHDVAAQGAKGCQEDLGDGSHFFLPFLGYPLEVAWKPEAHHGGAVAALGLSGQLSI